MYDYFLGGKDHFEADRKAAEKVIAAYPETRTVARANRRFLTRAVWYLAEHGIGQYVDLGSGMPTSPTVHEIARQVRPEARVVYVDNDPVVASHCRFVCDGDRGLGFIEGDIRAPQDILTELQLSGTIDLSKPVAFLFAAVLHFVPDKDEPKGIVSAFRWRMAPGSYLVISHGAADNASRNVLSKIADVYQGATAPAVPRTAREIREFFSGLDLVEPGLVDVARWRSDMKEKATKIRLLAGVGRKPGNLPMAWPDDHRDGWHETRRETVNSKAGTRERAMPKYVRVAAAVRAQIEDGMLLPGEPVPSGAALSRATGYSALTCRRALRALIQDGVLAPGASPGARPRVPPRTPVPGDQNLADAARVLSASLAARRRAVGLTQPQFAKVVGLSVTTIGHAETGRVWQSRHFWEQADKAVGAGGELLALHDAYRAVAVPAGPAGETPVQDTGGDPWTIAVAASERTTCVAITWANGVVTTVYPPRSASPVP